MFLGEIDSFFNLIDRLKNWGTANRKQKYSLADRFCRLFEAHGVHRNQIPRFLGELELSDVATNESLLLALTDTILDKASSTFGIRREWLDGASEQIYKHQRFYKHPEDFKTFIDELGSRSDYVGGELLIGKEKKKHHRSNDAVLILEEGIGWVGEKQIYRYHFCDEWVFPYWKARAYLTACVAAGWEKKIYIHGHYVEPEIISKLCEGEMFVPHDSFHGGMDFDGARFDPEDMALDPERFLDGVDEGTFGKKSALELWLKLEKTGFMASGFGDPPREIFHEFLRKL